MEALASLARLDRIYAVITAAMGAAALGGLLVARWFMDEGGPALGWLLIGLGALVLVGTTAMVALLVVTSRHVAQGRWRGVQTALGLMAVASNPPLGTAFGLYALWVCWVHPGAKARFAGRAEPAADAALQERSLQYARLARRLVTWSGAVYIVLTLGIMAGVGGVLSWGQQEGPVEVTAEHIALGGMYGETVDRTDIEGVELRGGLPTITLRTNGYALGDTLLGWFSTREHGKVKLLVHSGEGPFVYITRQGGLLIYASADPDRTRAVYEQLRGGSAAP